MEEHNQLGYANAADEVIYYRKLNYPSPNLNGTSCISFRPL